MFNKEKENKEGYVGYLCNASVEVVPSTYSGLFESLCHCPYSWPDYVRITSHPRNSTAPSPMLGRV